MTSIIKNMAIVLGLITIAFAGYYIYINKDGMVLQSGVTNGETAQMLARSTEFIQYRQELDQLMIDTNVFESAHFRALTSYSEPIIEQPVGRDNPFISPTGVVVNQSAVGNTSESTTDN